jgi:pyruvate formate-lyase activating enzyme-like uncharacterized protein
MKIQTISVVVPTNGCVNNCLFCVAKTHVNPYTNLFKETKNSDKIYYRNDIKRRLQFASLQGVDTLILTGTGEPLQNIEFLELLNGILNELNHPFPRIELQTSGVLLSDNNLRFLRDMNITTVSISVANIFNNERNLKIINVTEKLKFYLEYICESIQKLNLNIRLSLNLTKEYKGISPEKYFMKAKMLGASQITFRKLYALENATPEDLWVNEFKLPDEDVKIISDYVNEKGSLLYVLPFGCKAYSIHGISTVIDHDCLDDSVKPDDIFKFLILRENGKLYTQWNDEGSIIF